MNVLSFVVLCIGAYLLGSIPFGLIYSNIRGVDIRNIGSGNIGATNVSRAFGFWKGFLPITLLDMGKAAIPTFYVYLNAPTFLNVELAAIIVGICAILGHVYSIFLKFKGGKGVSCAAGAFLIIAPVPTILAGIVFLGVFLISRVVALASIIAAISFPFFVFYFTTEHGYLFIISVFIPLFICYTHRSNIKNFFTCKKIKKNQNKEEIKDTKENKEK